MALNKWTCCCRDSTGLRPHLPCWSAHARSKSGTQPLKWQRFLNEPSTPSANGAGRVASAKKKPCGRGKGGEWLVSNEELMRLKNEGLLPFPRPA